MHTLQQYLKTLINSPVTRLGPDEAYLAGAEDICDLERRMRNIDDRGRGPFSAIVYGLYPR